jgi:hypothetical protein
MSIVMVTAMAMAMIAMIDHHLFCDSDGTIAAIVYFSFYI